MQPSNLPGCGIDEKEIVGVSVHVRRFADLRLSRRTAIAGETAHAGAGDGRDHTAAIDAPHATANVGNVDVVALIDGNVTIEDDRCVDGETAISEIGRRMSSGEALHHSIYTDPVDEALPAICKIEISRTVEAQSPGT